MGLESGKEPSSKKTMAPFCSSMLDPTGMGNPSFLRNRLLLLLDPFPFPKPRIPKPRMEPRERRVLLLLDLVDPSL